MPTKMKKLLLAFLWLFILFSSGISLGYNIGFKKITYSQDNLTIVLLYPSETENAAEEHGVFSKGNFPLLIFSHGMEGSADNQYYIASYMAKNGYIVAAIEHDDNPYRFQTFVDRPILTKKAIDLILNDSKINTYIDPNKIGMLGHSLGGYTSFVIAGGEPDFSNHPNLNWMPNFLKKFYIKFRNFDNNFYDSRVKAIAVLAPGLGSLFNKESVSKVSIPVLIIEAEKDEVVLDGSASLYKNNLPKKPEFIVLKGAGHYSFLPLCNEYLQKNFAEICFDPETPRKELHQIIQQQVLSFFNEVLK
jgi:predicted dienelactone hydrolase